MEDDLLVLNFRFKSFFFCYHKGSSFVFPDSYLFFDNQAYVSVEGEENESEVEHYDDGHLNNVNPASHVVLEIRVQSKVGKQEKASRHCQDQIFVCNFFLIHQAGIERAQGCNQQDNQ